MLKISMLFARFQVGFFIILNNCQKKFKQSTFYEDIFFFQNRELFSKYIAAFSC